MQIFLRNFFSKLNYTGSLHKMGTNAVKNCKEPVAVRSYIFLDLETTGLPHLENRRTKITELSLLGVLREHLDHSSEFFDSKLSLPRVIHKLSICVYPNKQILPSTTDMTGLSNSVLEHQKPFDEALFNMIETFIKRLPGPVCILAHNGFVFDFPILQSEIHNLGKVLSDDLLCADTLTGFKNTLHKVNVEPKLIEEDIKPLYTTVESYPVVHDRTIWDDAISESDLISVATNVETFFNDDWCDSNDQEYSSLQSVNETTPKINRTRCIATPVVGDLLTPPTTPPKKGTSQATGSIRTFKKKLSLTSLKDSLPKKSFKLGVVYKHLFGHELYNSHRAEADAEALLQCVANHGAPILDWIDCNTKYFSNVKKMW